MLMAMAKIIGESMEADKTRTRCSDLSDGGRGEVSGPRKVVKSLGARVSGGSVSAHR